MSSIIQTYLNELRHSQFMPPELMTQYQRRLLEVLIKHAHRYVPFYRESGRLRPMFRPDGSIIWENWKEVPLLTRNEVQRAGDALRSEHVPIAHGAQFQLFTSGSTSEPVGVWHTVHSTQRKMMAFRLREFENHRTDPRKRIAWLAPFTPDDFDITGTRKRHEWHPGHGACGLGGERFDISDMRPASELINEVMLIRPSYIRAQPIVLELMCAYDAAGQLPDLKLEGVLCEGENFPANKKQEISRYLGCPISDRYGSAECGRIAPSCPRCGRFHIESENAMVEILDDNGSPAPAGQVGWVVVTPFHNFAMPLIRYDHADRAKLGAEGQCKVRLSAIDEIFGKERTAFFFPGNLAIRPSLPPSTMIKLLGAQVIQVVQVAVDRCEVNIVPGKLTQAEMQFEACRDLLRSIWWKNLQVDFRLVEQIPRASRHGKMAMFVQRIPKDELSVEALQVRSGKSKA